MYFGNSSQRMGNAAEYIYDTRSVVLRRLSGCRLFFFQLFGGGKYLTTRPDSRIPASIFTARSGESESWVGSGKLVNTAVSTSSPLPCCCVCCCLACAQMCM